MLQAEARLSSFVLPKAKSHGDTARSRKSSFVAVVGFCDLQNEGKRVERAKGKEPGVSTEQSSEASEKSVVVVGHRVTKDGMEYLVKGTQEPDSAGMWIPRENVDLTLVAVYTRRQRASRCST